jgi:hypothetical protein
MTKAKISQYDPAANNNTDVNNINIAEGCAPSGINNAIREVMAALKRFQTGSDGDSVTVGGNLIVSGSVSLATDLPISEGGTGASTAAAARENLNAVGYTTTTGSVIIIGGTEAQRDGSPQAGFLRFNTDTDSFEGYNGTAWGGIGGAQAGGAIVTNKDVASVSYVIDSGENGFSVGPITVADGTTITVSDGQRWLIL